MTRARGEAPHAAQVRASALPVITVDAAGDTPILREYRAVKEQYPEAIVLARLGDFFELFGADAEVAAPLLGLTLTGRGFGSAGRVPMCGVPHHSVMQHIRRLLEHGHRVAVWDQVGRADPSGKLVEREVTRVLSPGMLVDAELVDASSVVRCVALHAVAGRVGVAAFDAAAGNLQLCEVAGGLDSAALLEECERLEATELLIADDVAVPPSLASRALRTRLAPACFDPRRGGERLREATGAASLIGFGVETLNVAHGAAGAMLLHCERSRLNTAHLRVGMRDRGSVMCLDAGTRRNLELTSGLNGEATRSLLALLDRTRTAMGARLLRARLLEPLITAAAIEERLDAVADLCADRRRAAAVADALGEVRDLERLTARCVQGMATPRDLGAIRAACAALPALREALAHVPARQLRDAGDGAVAPAPLHARLAALLVDEPPATLREGGAIRAGADGELDDLRGLGGDARQYLAGLEARERERTGIRSLRVGYNRVFGYYIEVPNAHAQRVPAEYIRKQTLAGAERYLTAELKEHEAAVLGSRDRALVREQELLRELVALVATQAAPLLAAAGAVACIDVAQSMATVAAELGWERPAVDDGGRLEITEGRHPLVEQAVGSGRFVANDCLLDVDGPQLLLLTGPNMAGKSTYLRQVASIVLLAQVGSFVPATAARIGVCDRIFTRVGAHDDLAGGLSTFMVEMAETAAILNRATPRSLVILDEIGRGTSTLDGLAIAQAVAEHLHEAPQLGCRTLFATHYHELCALAGVLPRVRNARVDVLEDGDRVVFVHRIVEGGADRSYGIHVARLAGIPQGVLVRARGLLQELEVARDGARSTGDQMSLQFGAVVPAHPLVEQLSTLDLEMLTPLAALNKLAEWRERLTG